MVTFMCNHNHYTLTISVAFKYFFVQDLAHM